ncbi:MAG: beta-glucuronidase [Ruminococcaceae bacterium]|nr:beta-glucuronidase [Oscillospiraceae bacterium]
MAEFIKLSPDTLKELHQQNPMLMSYNVEFAEVTGGTFWKAYTPGQIAGTEEFHVEPSAEGIAAMYKDLMQVYPPINLYNEKLRKLTKDLGPAWCRISGTWATKTYYDFDGEYPGNQVPEGYLNKLTKEQWIGVLDFVRDCGLKLKISMANCPGLHSAEEPWPSTEAEKIFKLSKEYGVPIEAAEFANEPNMMEDTGFPKGYTAAHYRRDADLFGAWLKENYPECLLVGPSDVGGMAAGLGMGGDDGQGTGGIEQLVKENVTVDALVDGCEVPLDVYSYHYYNGVSDRLASVMPMGHWQPEQANSEAFLAVPIACCQFHCGKRDKYVPGGEMWVTESGEAGGGGSSWSSTYLDVLRTLNELGGFSALTRGIIFHNTLTASDYAFLDRNTHDPRPNFFAVKLWQDLMGTTVYDTAEPVRMGAHVYCQSYKADPSKKCYLIVNNSETDATTVELPSAATVYTLAGKDGNKRAAVMTLNGRDLVLGENNELPDLSGMDVAAGKLELAPMTCTFLVI